MPLFTKKPKNIKEIANALLEIEKLKPKKLLIQEIRKNEERSLMAKLTPLLSNDHDALVIAISIPREM
tara:strand:+ start:62 stop:265 length:204 start_codon:yes stop_codon:yes gene_type:complete